jgi:mRNA interferase MazF
MKQGDIVYTDFDPTLGREQSGRRPAVIISQTEYNQRRNLVWICPITSSVKSLRFHVRLDDRTKIQGDVICEQVRTIDLLVRKCRYVEPLSKDLLQKVLDAVSVIIAVEESESDESE